MSRSAAWSKKPRFAESFGMSWPRGGVCPPGSGSDMSRQAATAPPDLLGDAGDRFEGAARARRRSCPRSFPRSPNVRAQDLVDGRIHGLLDLRLEPRLLVQADAAVAEQHEACAGRRVVRALRLEVGLERRDERRLASLVRGARARACPRTSRALPRRRSGPGRASRTARTEARARRRRACCPRRCCC